MRSKHRRARECKPSPELLGTLARYWLAIFPIARQELGRWRKRAEEIPNGPLRQLARLTLTHEGLNAEGAALFATLAPLAQRAAVVRLLVRFQVMYDYLDVLTEQPAEEPLRTSRQLHLALTAALGGTQPRSSYYAFHTYQDDGGYLDELVAGCRVGFAWLPSAAVAAPFALDAARRSAEGQSHSHAAVQIGNGELIRWASGEAPALRLRWWETAAASESSLVIHALLASAADPAFTPAAAERVAAAYWPWITGLNALLDDLVDRAEDAAEGTHSYVEHYADPELMALRFEAIAARATAAVRELPHSRRHAVILAAMTSFYLAAPGAALPGATATAQRVREQLDVNVRLLLAVLRLRRRLGGGG